MNSKTQTSRYVDDLAALQSILQKTPSYRTQAKGDKLIQYNKLYKRLASDSVSNSNDFTYFYNLAQLLFPLRDNHLGFYQLPNYNHFKNQQSIDSFIQTKEFLDHPALSIDTDSLRIELSKKPADSVEGIYHYGKFYTIGLFEKKDKEYIGVVVDSDVKLWRKGQVAVHLYAFAPNLYKAIYSHPIFKNFILQPVEKYQNQSLANSYFYASYSQDIYSKQLPTIDHINLPKGGSKFELKNISNDVQYLLIKTFQANYSNLQESQRFYDSTKHSLSAKHLVLDLRNNEGGAKKEMMKYFRLLKNYVKTGHLYVLVNNGTLSQAEIFTLKLKQLKNVTTFGQSTRGMLAYGSNYGKRVRLPSGRFEIYPTDMKGDAKLLLYEDHGVSPDIFLAQHSNWIEQVINLMHQK